MVSTPTDVVAPDATALRAERRARALAEMEADGIDILVLGREGNARYVSGTPRLWTAGSRPFTPGCVLVRATGDVHLLSTWDEGVPDDIPHEHLYGITFNPMNMVGVLQGVAGAATAERVGTDSLTPMFAQLLPAAFPAAEIVDGEATMRRARQVKTPNEVDEIRASVAIAERCLSVAETSVVPGTTERRVTGAFMEEMARSGVTTPSGQDVAWVTSTEHPWRRTDRDTRIGEGDLVVLTGSVVRGGYTGELGRTHTVGGGHDGLRGRLDELRSSLLAACTSGTRATALLDAYRSMGIPPPPVPIARGLGLGFDLPIISHDLPQGAEDEPLEAGWVVALTSYAWEQGAGAVIAIDPVHITDEGPDLLSSAASNSTAEK